MLTLDTFWGHTIHQLKMTLQVMIIPGGLPSELQPCICVYTASLKQHWRECTLIGCYLHIYTTHDHGTSQAARQWLDYMDNRNLGTWVYSLLTLIKKALKNVALHNGIEDDARWWRRAMMTTRGLLIMMAKNADST